MPVPFRISEWRVSQGAVAAVEPGGGGSITRPFNVSRVMASAAVDGLLARSYYPVLPRVCQSERVSNPPPLHGFPRVTHTAPLHLDRRGRVFTSPTTCVDCYATRANAAKSRHTIYAMLGGGGLGCCYCSVSLAKDRSDQCRVNTVTATRENSNPATVVLLSTCGGSVVDCELPAGACCFDSM